ncbi:hypothetical protein NL676_035542 [Syzygium grande]|nr:hypothetical protein NL676_035542 [Syzygium grande]
MALAVVLDTVGTLGSTTVAAVTRETRGLGRFAMILGQLVISVYKLAEVIVCEWVLCLPASPLQIFFTGEVQLGRRQRATGDGQQHQRELRQRHG